MHDIRDISFLMLTCVRWRITIYSDIIEEAVIRCADDTMESTRQELWKPSMVQTCYIGITCPYIMRRNTIECYIHKYGAYTAFSS